jgi:hypothetical protein
MWLVAKEVQTRHEDGSNTGINAVMVKPPKFAGPMSWALFHQFCAMVDHDS